MQMVKRAFCSFFVLAAAMMFCHPAVGQHDSHASAAPVRPKVFLDKSAKAVEYQLKRLSNQQLLMVEVATDHPKYIPVFAAILSRPGMSTEQRLQAADGLSKLTKQSLSAVLLDYIGRQAEEDRGQYRVANELTDLLLKQAADKEVLVDALKSEQYLVQRAAVAALIQMSQLDPINPLVQSGKLLRSYMAGIALVPNPEQRAKLRQDVLDRIEHADASVQASAIAALPRVTNAAQVTENAQRLKPVLLSESTRPLAVRSLLATELKSLDAAVAESLVEQLVQEAESASADVRTSEAFIDMSQLIERLASRIPDTSARKVRARMKEIAVRTVRIRTIEEEMRYDLKYFVAEAGKPIQIILENGDLMPHNLVVTVPNALKLVAMTAATMAPDALTDGKQYVPSMPEVLFATKMVQAGKSERMVITAPAQPGEYPFVCTYPNHWMRMYGVMVVTGDIDAFLQSPVEPKDPIGNNRAFVKNWKVSDLDSDLVSGLAGRNPEIGAKLFQEATCLQCHAVDGKGGRVGPDLRGVLKRHESSVAAVLKEILEPSHKIDPKYASHSILTQDGQVYSGVLVSEDEKTVAILSSPDQPKPTVLQRSDIEEMQPSSKSMMPAALLDQFSQQEIFEILAYVIRL